MMKPMRRRSLDSVRNARVTSAEMCSPDDTADLESPTVATKQPAVGLSVWEKMARWGAFYMLVSPYTKIFYYTITLLIFSMLHASGDVPHFEVLTGKYSILNQVFVKQGWGITFAVYVFYQLVSTILHHKKGASLRRLMAGAVVTTLFFFIWCQVIFPTVEHLTSFCTAKNISVALGKRECLKLEDHEYYSFDISGHSYLLTYCVLVMMEEGKGVLYYLRLGEYLRGTGGVGGRRSDELSIPCWTRPAWVQPDDLTTKSFRMWYPIISPLVALSFVALALLALLWDFMLIITTVYYHTFIEKVLGTFLAIAMWHLIYGQIFRIMGQWKVFVT